MHYLSNFINFYSKIERKNQNIFTGVSMDIRSSDGLMVTTAEDRKIENFLSSLSLLLHSCFFWLFLSSPNDLLQIKYNILILKWHYHMTNIPL